MEQVLSTEQKDVLVTAELGFVKSNRVIERACLFDPLSVRRMHTLEDDLNFLDVSSTSFDGSPAKSLGALWAVKQELEDVLAASDRSHKSQC